MVDNLTREQRSRCMSRVRTRNTDIERALRSALHRRGFRFRKHVKALPGCPDLVFVSQRAVVFIDGDFWHGYRYPTWAESLSPFWRRKIEINRRRDQRNFRRLRHRGWKVIRIWQHEVERDLLRCVGRIVSELRRNTAA